MPDTGRSSRGSRNPGAPEVPANPPSVPSGDYTYVLEIVMNMQNSMGKLVEAVDSLKTQSRNRDQKQDDAVKEIRMLA